MLFRSKIAARPLNGTATVVVSEEPFMVIDIPGVPPEGVKSVMEGLFCVNTFSANVIIQKKIVKK